MQAETWEFLAKEILCRRFLSLNSKGSKSSCDELIGALNFLSCNVNPGVHKREHLKYAKLVPKTGR